jgi:uncharacterized protein YjbI with pentapeptide repeats
VGAGPPPPSDLSTASRPPPSSPDGSEKAASGFDLSGAIISEAKFTGANFKEAILSKAYAKVSYSQNEQLQVPEKVSGDC